MLHALLTTIALSRTVVSGQGQRDGHWKNKSSSHDQDKLQRSSRQRSESNKQVELEAMPSNCRLCSFFV